jgi:hypothetical protein
MKNPLSGIQKLLCMNYTTTKLLLQLGIETRFLGRPVRNEAYQLPGHSAPTPPSCNTLLTAQQQRPQTASVCYVAFTAYKNGYIEAASHHTNDYSCADCWCPLLETSRTKSQTTLDFLLYPAN